MADKQNSRENEYRDRQDTAPHKQTGDINARNNNQDNETPSVNEPNVERANDTGIGDSGWNDDKLSNYTSNHSADA
ncbi:MAG: hypothetical protein M3342_07385 [Bacteroidota bacterium]|nr:hypothetical protein [Bacteroidota bacterium]